MTDAFRRLMLTAVLSGAAAMFAASVLYRMDDHPLVHKAHAPQPRAMPVPEPSASSEAAAENPQTMIILELMQKMKSNPHDVETLLELADLFAGRGDTHGANGMLERASVAAPSDPRPPYLMGVAHAKAGRWPEAVQAMERSLALKDNSEVHYSIAVIYRYHLKQEDKARIHFEAASKLTPEADLAARIDTELKK